MESVGIILALTMMVVLLLVAHHDGLMVGEERGRNSVYYRELAHCRVSEAPVSGMFYDQERDV